MPATYDSATVLAAALRRAEAAHGRHEEEIGHPDPDWYARYMEQEQADNPGQTNPEASR